MKQNKSTAKRACLVFIVLGLVVALAFNPEDHAGGAVWSFLGVIAVVVGLLALIGVMIGERIRSNK